MATSDDVTRKTNLNAVAQVFELISTSRSNEVGPLLTDDLYFELPYGPGRKPLETKGREPFLEQNAKTWPAFTRFALTIERVHELVDPNKLILEYTSDGEIKSTGKPYRNRYVGIFGFRDGRICEWHEFHNPEVPAWAFRPSEPR